MSSSEVKILLSSSLYWPKLLSENHQHIKPSFSFVIPRNGKRITKTDNRTLKKELSASTKNCISCKRPTLKPKITPETATRNEAFWSKAFFMSR